MINLILSILILHLLNVIILKRKFNTLNCGIFAWSGKDTKSFDKMKFNILGILNETRGKDSCGVTVDGDIHIGVDNNKVFRDFISNKGYPSPKKNPVVIGHTRASTVGLKNEDNAHPFGFGSLGDGYEFVGVHNGTLLNHKEIAPEYGVELTTKVNAIKPASYRLKIDSELLLETIYKSKSFKVLNEYNGAAALMFTNINEPNVLYCYHGASHLKSFNQEGVFEERPLFYWNNAENSMYISSQKEGLQSIGAEEKDINIFPHNRVYKIVDGVINKQFTFVVDREGRYQNEASNPNKPSIPSYSYYGKHSAPVHRPNTMSNRFSSSNYKNNNVLPKNYKDKKIEDVFNIYSEKALYNQKATKEKIIFQNLRYKRNGHLINGCYIYVKSYGFVFLGYNAEEGKKTFQNLINKPFTTEHYNMISDIFQNPDYIPLKFEDPKKVCAIDYIDFMYKGVHIKTIHDYYACIDMENNGKEFDFMALSACSKHPIMNIVYEKRSANRQLIYFNNELANVKICPLGSHRIYTIEEGNCIDMKVNRNLITTLAVIKEEKKVINIDSIEDSNILKDAEKSILESEKKQSKIDMDKKLETVLEEAFNTNFQTIPSTIEKLETFNGLKKADKAKQLLLDFQNGVRDIIGIEEIE